MSYSAGMMDCGIPSFNSYVCQGYEHAKKAALEFLEGFKENLSGDDREILRCVARTSLRTKLYVELADQLTDIVVDAVLTIRKNDEPIDLFMVSPQLCRRSPLCIEQKK